MVMQVLEFMFVYRGMCNDSSGLQGVRDVFENLSGKEYSQRYTSYTYKIVLL